ncbi:flavin reductase family protein [Proteiniclasticum sp. SCR006]|uniref:Flavin reductase family protein n=1 Tax=Proteiniclasticum aestuarii TaxID=2817862 RepID=A0A939HBH3_9CLOT|nr:flavin reductase family protein [Proteiniclasticum aestuarii]MBO1264892.1 flavin reductase family protein [Proteiniclasticum aestuarii]
MISIDPGKNSERENYKLLIGTIIPRPIAFVTTLGEGGVVNAAPFSYFNVVSSSPPLISLSIQRRKGELKDTARNILREKEFVVHGVDEENVDEVNETAASLPSWESELKLTKLTLLESDLVKVPGIQESKVRMECRLVQHMPLGDGDEIGADLFIGRIVRFHIDEKVYEKGRIDPHALSPMSRLAGISYARIGEIISMERPE